MSDSVDVNNTDVTFIGKFLRQETSAGILLVAAAVLAIVLANSPLASYYQLLIDTAVTVSVGTFILSKPLLLWINDGLMAVFFLLVGLELKREIIEGELSDRKKIVMPALGAVGGMVVPAAIYLYFNISDPVAAKGWAIPAATDIAFALGVLSLLGSRVPASFKIFLTSLAIFDDIGAIVIIALFYTSKLSILALVVAMGCIVVMYYLNRRGVSDSSVYIVFGLIMWLALLKSGVHATLAGIILAIFIPMKSREEPEVSPLKRLESDLHPAVAYLILPIFSFFNSGVSFIDVTSEQILHAVPVGIALGLVVGKQVGVFGFCWFGIKMGLAKRPDEISWLSLYGLAVLTGVGFTMSLFIGSLAFEESGVDLIFDERIGIIIGSLVSGVLGYLVLFKSLRTISRSEAD